MKEVRAYIFGLVDGVLIGIGCVDIMVAWLVARGRINPKMLDPKYVRENYIYKPNAPWIRNHFDYSYHGRHYSPYRRHYAYADPKPAWQINPECSGCVYEGMSADFDPCKSCKRAFDGYPEDHFKLEACEYCKHKGAEPDDWPCSECCQRIKDALEDYYEYRGDEPEAEAEKPEDEKSLEEHCYKCKHFENDISESPCDDCEWAFPYGVGNHPDHFEADEED